MPYSYKSKTKFINDGENTICTPHKVVYLKKTSTIQPERAARWKPVNRFQPNKNVTSPLDPNVTYRPPPIPTPQPNLPPLTPTQSKSHKTKSLMQPRNKALRHPAADALLQYASDGCPLDCGQDWTMEQMEAAIQKGPHQSAQSPEASNALRTEALERITGGSCRVMKWKDIKDNPPPKLKISPIAAIPHKSQLFRMILDLSYKLKMDKDKLKSVNNASDKDLAPQHSMYELGNVIPQIIWNMAKAPDTGVPILFSKIDLKDGYWRMVVNEADTWNFAYVLSPLKPGDDIELVIPDALQMGWSESPPFFCAATETA